MDTEQIIQTLNRRFREPLKEYYKRHIIFWIDEDGEFAELIEDMELADAKIIILDGRNSFAVKKLLCHDDVNSNYLVYRSGNVEDKDNWLLDVELFSEEFHADLISIWIEEIGLSTKLETRKIIKSYKKFFNAKDRRSKIKAYAGQITAPGRLRTAIMTAICGIKDHTLNPSNIALKVLQGGLEEEHNQAYQALEIYGAEEDFWRLIEQGTGFVSQEPTLQDLAAYIIISAATRSLPDNPFFDLQQYMAPAYKESYCYDLVAGWMRGVQQDTYLQVIGQLDKQLSLEKRLQQKTPESIMANESLPFVDKCILTSLMGEVVNNIIDVEKIREIALQRRNTLWYSQVEIYYDGLVQLANMQQFYLEHSAGFHQVDPKEIWDSYTKDYYKMDSYYRQFQMAFAKCLTSGDGDLNDLFKQIKDKAEGLYVYWFLGELGTNWATMSADNLQNYGYITGISQQEKFYANKIRNAENRVFVIISDAFRYDVAVSLAEQLEQETQAEVHLGSQQAIFPSITKCGMAALLPHKALQYVDNGTGIMSVLADGKSTESQYRDRVLKSAKADSLAILYKKIVSMRRDERKEVIKGNEVVYIYHDAIDEAGHSGNDVFAACEKAIEEIKALLRIIVNDFGGTNIIITADHGFLYTNEPLNEDGKIDGGVPKNSIVDSGRRHIIAHVGADNEYMQQVKLVADGQDMEGFAPRGAIRIQKQGGGQNYVHGGISLQELVVPVLEYHYLRNQTKKYLKNKDKYDSTPVALDLLTKNKRITNMIWPLKFYQKEAVSGNKVAANYTIYFEDGDGTLISDEQHLLVDKTDSNEANRVYQATFNLKSLKYDSKATYYLCIKESTGKQLPQKIEFNIDIAMATDDFGFF